MVGTETIARYFTAEELGAILGVDTKRIYAAASKGLVRPALTRLRQQFDRAGLVRLAVFFTLQDAMGTASVIPSMVVRNASAEIDATADEIVERGMGTLDVSIEMTPGRKLKLEIPCESRINTEELRKVPA